MKTLQIKTSKILTILLMMALLFVPYAQLFQSQSSVPTVYAGTAEGGLTVYFKKPGIGWGNTAYIHFWNANGSVSGTTWGSNPPMVKIADDWWAYTIPGATQANFLFKDWSGDTNNKKDNNGANFYTNADRWYNGWNDTQGAAFTNVDSDSTAPTAPGSLASSSVTETGFTLTWNKSTDNGSGIKEYKVYRGGTLINTVNAYSSLNTIPNSYSVNVSGLSAGTTYAMQVEAVNHAGLTTSSTLNVTTADTTAPTAPTGLSSSNITETTATLSWTASSDNVGVTAYEVFRGATSLGTTVNTSFNVTGLSINQTYSMTVRARDAAGNNSAASSAHSITTADVTAPSAPTGLSSANVTGTSATLSWTAASDNVGVNEYEIFNGASSIGTTANTSFNITGLTNGQTYSMTVKAKDAAGNVSSASTALSITTLDTSDPTAPTGVTSSNVTETSATLSWTAATDNVGVTSYEVFKNGTSIGSTSNTSFEVTGLTAGQTYSMTVKAKDAAGNVSLASTAHSLTTADTTAPSTPNGLSSSNITYTGFTVSWTAASDNVGVTSYEVYLDGSNEPVGTTSGTSFNVTGLNASTAYSVTVKAKDGAGNASSASSSLSVTTSEYVVDNSAPSVPSGLTISGATGTSLTLSWTASTDTGSGVASYEVFVDGVSVSTTSATTIELSGLTEYTNYSLTVKAKDAANNESEASTALSTKTKDVTAPTAPTALAVSNVTATGATLTWEASTDSGAGVKEYEIYANDEKIGTVAAGTLTYNVTGLTPETPYSFTVKAVDNETPANTSTASNAESATTLVLTDSSNPNAPTGLKFTTVTFTTVLISWNAATDVDENGGISGYEIYVGGQAVGTVDGETLSYTLTGLTPNTLYSVTVKAKDLADKLSVDSNTITPRTARDTVRPIAPTGLSASSVTATGATLTWTAGTDNVAVKEYVVSTFNGTRKIKDYPAVSATSITVTDLTKDTRYTFRVVTKDTSNNLSAAFASLLVTTGNPPTPPTTISAINKTYSAFTLMWSGAGDDTVVKGYDVLVNDVKHNTTMITGTEYTVTGLNQGTEYDIKIRAIDGIGNLSALSESEDVETLEYAGNPALPKATLLTAVSDTSVTLRYNPLSGLQSPPVPHFRAVTDPVSEFAAVDPANITAGTNSLTITGLTAATAYEFRLVAGAGETAVNGPTFSATTSVACEGACPAPVVELDQKSPLMITALTKTTATLKYKLNVAANVTINVINPNTGATVIPVISNTPRRVGVQTQAIKIPTTLTNGAPTVPDGTYIVQVIATSTAAPAKTDTLRSTFVIDRVNPAISEFTAGNLSVIPDGENNTPNSTISFKASEIVNATVSIFASNGKTLIRSIRVEGDVLANETVSVVWNGTNARGQAVPDAIYIVRVTATDLSGNRFTTANANIHVERVNPTLTKITPVTASLTPFRLDTRSTSKAAITVNFTTSELSRFKVELLDSEGIVIKTLTPATTFDSTLEAAGAKRVVWDGIGATTGQKAADGAYSLKITAFDRADNEVTSTVHVNADSTAPTLAWSETNETVTGTVGTGATVNYTISEAVSVTVIIKNQAGATVRTIERAVNKTAESYPGTIAAVWNGKVGAGAGTNAIAGTYTMEITAIDLTRFASNKLVQAITLTEPTPPSGE